MLHKTKGIVLRTVKYGETSLICTIFTELLGIQTYMVKGVRSAKAKSRKANAFFAASLLDMVVYHNPQKNLQMIKEYQPSVIFQTLNEDVVKNGVAIFGVEVIGQLLTQLDTQPELFTFFEEFLLLLDQTANSDLANFPLYFLIQAGKLSGYYLSGQYDATYHHVNIHDGRFSTEAGHFPPFIEGYDAALMSTLNSANTLHDIKNIKMNGDERKRVLSYFLAFLQAHVPHFTPLKSLPVLAAILY